jgi:hypothetical protein
MSNIYLIYSIFFIEISNVSRHFNGDSEATPITTKKPKTKKKKVRLYGIPTITTKCRRVAKE